MTHGIEIYWYLFVEAFRLVTIYHSCIFSVPLQSIWAGTGPGPWWVKQPVTEGQRGRREGGRECDRVLQACCCTPQSCGSDQSTVCGRFSQMVSNAVGDVSVWPPVVADRRRWLQNMLLGWRGKERKKKIRSVGGGGGWWWGDCCWSCTVYMVIG